MLKSILHVLYIYIYYIIQILKYNIMILKTCKYLLLDNIFIKKLTIGLIKF